MSTGGLPGITTVPIRTFGAGGGSGDGIISLPEVQHVLFVDKGAVTGSEDGTRQNPYHAVGDALTAAAALTPTSANPVAIYMLPGLYEEEGLTSQDHVRIIGVSRESVRIEASNDAVFYIQHANFTLENLWLNQTGTDPIMDFDTAMSAPARFYGCRFSSETAESNTGITFSDSGQARFERCELYMTAESYSAVISQDASVECTLTNCEQLGFLDINGGTFVVGQTRITGWVDYDAAGGEDLTITGCEIVNSSNTTAAHLGANPPDTLILTDNVLSSGTSYDVNAGVIASGSISGNAMSGIGYSAFIQPKDPVLFVGSSGDTDFYSDITDAIAAMPTGGSIKLLNSLNTGAIAFPAGPTTVDGNGFSWTTTTLSLNSTDVVYLRNIEIIGPITLDGSAQLYVKDSTLNNIITLGDAGTVSGVLHLVRVVLVVVASVCLNIRNANVGITVESSYLKGASTFAIYWNNSATNNNVKIKNSTICHGSLGANNPFGRNAAQTPTYYSHHTGYNSDPETGGIWTNLIAAVDRYESIDPNVDF